MTEPEQSTPGISGHNQAKSGRTIMPSASKGGKEPGLTQLHLRYDGPVPVWEKSPRWPAPPHPTGHYRYFTELQRELAALRGTLTATIATTHQRLNRLCVRLERLHRQSR